MQVIYFDDQIKIEEIKNEVNSSLLYLYNNYKEKYGNSINSIKYLFTFTTSSHFYKGALEILKTRIKKTTSYPNDTNDIDRYLSVETIPFEDNENFDILIWWKIQQIKYSILFIIACDVLTVPVSTVALEATFSVGGRVVSQRRCNVSPEAVETKVCLKDWKIADKRLHDFIREATLEINMENLKLSRHKWMHDSSPSPLGNDE